ncbi:MAG: transcriptional repressor [Erysipelotrichaceae bacterium]
MTYPSTLKKTANRQAVYDLFQNEDSVYTIKDLSSLLPEIHLSTLYRILACFIEANLIEESEYSSLKQITYQSKTHRHSHHMHCVICQKDILLKNCPIQLNEADLEGFKLIHHHIQIEGICLDCQKKASKL